jgi:hypothetical protein
MVDEQHRSVLISETAGLDRRESTKAPELRNSKSRDRPQTLYEREIRPVAHLLPIDHVDGL